MRKSAFRSFHSAISGLRSQEPRRVLYIPDDPPWREPFSGRPSYDTVARRFATHPDPVQYVRCKQAPSVDGLDENEAKKVNSEYMQKRRHEQTPYDVHISNLDEKTLETDVAQASGIPYLAKATATERNKRVDVGTAFVYRDHLAGISNKVIFPCVARFGRIGRWVHFVLDPLAPKTFISPRLAGELGLGPGAGNSVSIAGYPAGVSVTPKESHFAGLNLLGSDYLGFVTATQTIYPVVKLYFVEVGEFEIKS